ncbi:MAG: HEAT repeat domain-containing protein [Cyanobacteriota bacterium]|nr:HEAT repeat domain-containing protein [Cyanobacteriota bacterium]
MSKLTDSLEKILAWQERNRPEYAAEFQPGLTEEEIEEKLKHIPFRLPKEVYQLYQWRNGSTFDYFLPGSGFLFLPLERAIEEYEAYAEVHSTNLEYYGDDFGWNPYYFPIFCEGIENFLMTGSDEQQEESPVIYYFIEDASHDIFCSSLTKMVQVIAECYETGAYYITEERGRQNLVEDEVKVAQVLGKYNPELLDSTLKELQQVQKELSYRKLVSITYRLMWYKDSRTVEPLIDLLQVSQSDKKSADDIFQIQALAACILGRINDIRAVQPLIDVLDSEFRITRGNAAESLGNLGDSKAIEPLINALQDSDELAQNKAAFSLLKLNAVDALIKALKSDIPDIRLKAVKTLGLIKSFQKESCSQDVVNRVIEALSILSEDPLRSIREAVQNSLNELRR